ncbi:MAG: histidine kinase N-terminal domain-containing protein [Acidimicrobiales bacterium]|jgi:two-component sensor histidine kinase|nr:histidine kinase N-terminal domain-containing protein [Acidimicrobiales bacterium]
MPALSELAPTLEAQECEYLTNVIRSWDLLADLSFADLLLCIADDESIEASYTVVAHVRPTTSRSIYRTEMEGRKFSKGERPFFDQARENCSIIDGGLILQTPVERIRTLSVPVFFKGKVIAVLSRDFSPDGQRVAGELEMTYFSLFRRLALMISQDCYPLQDADNETEFSPRVSDGLMLLDSQGRVRFASPNSVSVLSRLNVRQIEGKKLGVEELPCDTIPKVFETLQRQDAEISIHGQVITLKCLPIIEDECLTGALVLVRDISELRRRDQLLRSKDSTIAEIHHRVKNNLQTISSLLHLQSRRVVASEARTAIRDSVRRIRSIAVVHEILSHRTEDNVEFSEIIKPLVRLVSEDLSSVERMVEFSVVGDLGLLPAAKTTALSVVLNELMQNVIQHGFSDVSTIDSPEVTITFGVSETMFEVSVKDNGIGLPEKFSDENYGLGLTIVRNLIEKDLSGSLQFSGEGSSGTEVFVRIPRF